MGRLVIVLIGAVAFLVTGYAGIHAPGTGLAARIETRLQEAANTALAQAGLDDWAQVQVDGQAAFLAGSAPREEDRGAARGAVAEALGSGGVLRGGVTRVVDQTELAPPLSPYVWRARRTERQLTLIGGAPSRAGRAEVLAHAQDLFPAGVIDRMRVARGAPDEAAWSAAARLGVSLLAQLREGEIVVTDLAMEVTGVAADSAAAERVRRSTAQAPSVYAVRVSLETMNASAPLAEETAPAPQAFRTPQACASALNAVVAERPILFTDKAVLAKEAYPVLDELVLIAKRCEAWRIETRVRLAPAAARAAYEAGASEQDAAASGRLALGAIGDGARPADPALAQARAQAIADYLVLQGVAPSGSLAAVEDSVGSLPDEDPRAYVFMVKD